MRSASVRTIGTGAVAVAAIAVFALSAGLGLRHAPAPEAATTERLQSRVELLARRLEALEAQLAARDAAARAAARAAPRAAASGNADGGSAPAPDPGALRELVRNVLREERAARFAATQRSQWETLRAFEDAREGPWGAHTARVQRMERTLDLDYAQTSYYHDLLRDFEGRIEAAARDLDTGADPRTLTRALAQLEAERARLGREFDAAFTRVLDPEQAERYGALPQNGRGPGPSAGLAALEFDLEALEGLADRAARGPGNAR